MKTHTTLIFVNDFNYLFSGTVPADYDRDDKIKCKGNHNHPPDFYEAEFCELERRILERSANEVLPLRRIFLEETTGYSSTHFTVFNASYY